MKSMTKASTALMLGIAITGIALGGCLGAGGGPVNGTGPGDGRRTAPVAIREESSNIDGARERWNFTGFNGSLRMEDTINWIDLAYPLWDGMDTDSVNVTVTVEWGDRSYEDDTQFWGWARHGIRTDGPPTASTWLSTHLNSFSFYRSNRDGVFGATVEHDGQEAAFHVPDPCTNVCTGNRTVWTVSETHIETHYDDLLRMEERPVVHLLFMMGGMAPDRVVVEAEWTDTVMAWTSGGLGDSFTFTADDFAWERSVVVDHPLSFYETRRSENGRLRVHWSEDDLPVMLMAWPGNISEHGREVGPKWAVRPNGSHLDLDTFFPGWVANQSGDWEFHFAYKRDNRNIEVPELWGTSFEWAEMPWKE